MNETRVSRRLPFVRGLRGFACAAVVAGAVVGSPSTARAEEVPPTAKGITGCALLGGELVVFGEAIFGVRSTGAYLLGAGAGIVAGGVGGYFLEQGVSDGRIPAYTLAGGLALLIPAAVVFFDATRYMPTEGAREDKPVTNVPPAEPGKLGGGSVVGAEPGSAPASAPAGGSTPGATPAPSTSAPAPAPSAPPATPAPAPGGGGGGTPAPMSLFDLHRGNFRMGAPVPQIRPIFTAAQEKTLAVQNTGTELRFPVMNITF